MIEERKFAEKKTVLEKFSCHPSVFGAPVRNGIIEIFKTPGIFGFPND